MRGAGRPRRKKPGWSPALPAELSSRALWPAAGMAALQAALPDCALHPKARAVSVNAPEPGTGEGRVLVLSAGTADAPVAEEAELTARMLGARTERLNDVGVAGLHRLLART